jgi:hypothetical protein
LRMCSKSWESASSRGRQQKSTRKSSKASTTVQWFNPSSSPSKKDPIPPTKARLPLRAFSNSISGTTNPGCAATIGRQSSRSSKNTGYGTVCWWRRCRQQAPAKFWAITKPSKHIPPTYTPAESSPESSCASIEI